MSADRHRIAASGVTATILADGAELCSLTDGAGNELLWQAGPVWPRHAPVLFPIVGRLADDSLRHEGRTYRLTQHGFARDRRFRWIDRSDAACRLALEDDAATRACFPFAFRFEIGFAVADTTLTVTYTLQNPASQTLLASFGAHPAFRWPLCSGTAKSAYTLVFPAPEPAPIRRLAGGLLLPERFPSPVVGRRLPLDESLFAADAVIFDEVASSSVQFAAPDGPAIEMAWEGFKQLGLWMRPGGDFLCIEPWRGHADPLGFAGPFREKPGIFHVPPGGDVKANYSVRLLATGGGV
jgi:galactose mutarotase-like enzyme